MRWKEVRDRAGQGHGTGQKEKDLWFRSDFTRFARSTVMVVLCNKIHIVCSILIIPPCQVAATKKSDFKKHKVLEGVTERQEKTGERKDGHFTKKQRQGNTKENPLKDSLVKFFLFFFFLEATTYGRERIWCLFPQATARARLSPQGGLWAPMIPPGLPLLTVPTLAYSCWNVNDHHSGTLLPALPLLALLTLQLRT